MDLLDVLTEKQLNLILEQSFGEHECELVGSEVRPATEGLAGFLGDHLRMSLTVEAMGCERKLRLFVKCLPRQNKDKMKFVDEGNFFRREMLMYEVFRELGDSDDDDDDAHPWHSKAFIYTDKILVMPDLALDGYLSRPKTKLFDMPHLLATADSVARFHAAYANHATKKTHNGRPYNFLDDYGELMEDLAMCDCPWVHACGKLSANFLTAFSTKYNIKNIPNLEEILTKLYVEACGELKEYDGTLNVVLHRDLWANNIMFRYENGAPRDAILLDYQCVRYGPPCFDLTTMLYLNTCRTFREQHNREIYSRYFSMFMESVDDATKERIRSLDYDFEQFLCWCERGRKFGMFLAIGIFPYVLMEPVVAQRHFDDPDTYHRYNFEDRSEPVMEFASQCQQYRDRQLELTEEFIERYVLKHVMDGSSIDVV